MSEGVPAPFVFGPRDRRGLVAGVRTGQVLLVAAALSAAVVLVRGGGRAGLAGALGVVVLAAGLGFWPVAGRTLDQWLPLALRHLAARARGAHAALFAGLETATLDSGGRVLGVIVDRARATASAAIAVGGATFALLEPDERLRRIAAWADLLSSLARETATLHRLQWVERTLPMRCLPDRLPPDGDRAAPYRALLRAERHALSHELLLVATVRTPRRGLDATARAALDTEVRSLLHRLQRSGLPEGRLLGPAELAAALRAVGERLPSALFGVGPPFPRAGRRRWTSVEAGALVHAAYWVAEWPRQAVGGDFLLPLLLAAEDRRSVSLVMAPVPPTRAARRAEHARTAKAADAALRERHGFALTARARREEEAVARRAAELAAGHAGYRFSGYVTVHAAGRAELAAACRRVEQAAALSHLTLARLDGAHDEGLRACLPLGRGLS